MDVKAWKMIRLTLLYGTVLILATYGTDFAFAHFSLGTSAANTIKLLTSPFNAHFEGDYADNIAFVIVMLAVAELYLRTKGRDKIVSDAFLASIAASYIISLDFLIDFKFPSAGSSIVGESLFVILAVSLFLDSLGFIREARKNSGRYESRTYTAYSLGSSIGVLSPLISAIFYYGAYLEGPSATTHLVGLAAFFVMLYLLRRIYFKRKAKRLGRSHARKALK